MNDTKLHKRKGLVVFDVEGVLLPKRRYIPFEATRKLGLLKFLRIAIFGILYEAGLLPLESALKRIYRYFTGYTVDELHSYYERIPLLPGVEKVFRHLHENGWKTALISSGLPHIFIQELANKLQADYAFGLKLEAAEGRFTGKIGGKAIKENGKAIILQEILNSEDIHPQNCILVADDRNNLQLFRYTGLKIGYNPDFMLSARSDHVVTGNLNKILPVMTQTKTKKRKQPMSRNQIIRETIHIGGFTVPFIAIHLLNRHLLALFIFIIALLYTMSELARIMGRDIPIFTHVTSHATVRLEKYEFAAAPIFYAFGTLLPLIVFPPPIGYASIAALTLGDGFAALIGAQIGRTRFPFNKGKNLEGSLTGLIFAFLGASLFIDPIRAFLGAVTGMLVECLPLPVSDNLTVPLITGAILTLTFA